MMARAVKEGHLARDCPRTQAPAQLQQPCLLDLISIDGKVVLV